MFSLALLHRSQVVEHVESGGQRLLELVGLLGVGDDESVEVARAAHLELGHSAGGLLDAHGAGILAAGREEEVLDLVDLLRLPPFSFSFRFVFVGFNEFGRRGEGKGREGKES